MLYKYNFFVKQPSAIKKQLFFYGRFKAIIDPYVIASIYGFKIS